jgi:hypothetical protein
MEPEGSLLCPQQPTMGPNPKADESSPDTCFFINKFW